MDHVDFFVDGQLRGTAATAPYEFLWHAGDDALGEHALRAVAWDVAGNSAPSTMQVLTVPLSAAGVTATIDAVTSEVLP
jgi:hypothetical protein